MLKRNAKGQLVELSLKQREQWLAYNYDNHRRNTPIERPPFLEQFPTMIISAPPKNKKM